MPGSSALGSAAGVTRVYVLALSLVAALSFAAFLMMHQVIRAHGHRAAVINTSGRQRMLLQRVALLGDEVSRGATLEDGALRAELTAAIDAFESAHHALSTRSATLGEPTSAVLAVYFGGENPLDRDIAAFVANARIVATAPPEAPATIAASAALRKAARSELLPRLDRVVGLNEAESERQVGTLLRAESLVLGATLLLLALEALYIFRPMSRRIARLLSTALDAREAAVRATDAKSAFLATVTHEIRTPLTGVVGIIEGLGDVVGLPARQRDQIDTLKRLSDSLITLVNDILDYSKIEAGKLSTEVIDFNLAAVVKDSQTLFAESAAAKGVALVFETDALLPAQLSGDPTRMRQVVANFVGNALKFTPRGGTVRVRFRQNGVRAEQIPFRVEVQDTGCGIPPAAQSALFARYAQADASTTRKYGGTGLGLYISKQIVEALGGTIGFQSVEGQGSTFWFELDLRAADLGPILEGDADQRSIAAPATVGVGRRVLLADDNLINQKIIGDQLKRLGFEVEFASNGEDAVAAARGRTFDVVLMDCEMPVLDGFLATKSLRALEADGSLPAMPIVAMTGHSDPSVEARCRAAGMNAFVTKPVSVKALGDALRVWL